MPNIELLKAQNISERVPGAQVQSTSHAIRAMGEIGGAIADFAFKLDEKRKQEDDKTFKIKSAIEYERKTNQFVNEARGKFNNDYNGFITAVEKNNTDLMSSMAKDAPSDNAKAMFEENALIHSSSQLIKVDNEINGYKINDHRQAFDDNINWRAQNIAQDSSPENVKLQTQLLMDDFNSENVLGQDEKQKIMAGLPKLLLTSEIDGDRARATTLGNNKAPQKERMQLAATYNKLMNDERFKQLSPDEFLGLKKNLENDLKLSKEKHANFISQTITYAASTGAPLDDKTYESLITLADQEVDPMKRDFYKLQINKTRDKSYFDKTMALVNPKDRTVDNLVEARTSSIENPLLKGMEKERVKNTFEESNQLLNLEFAKDSASYLANHDPQYASLIEQTKSGDENGTQAFQRSKELAIANYKNLGVHESQYDFFPKAITEHVGDSFKNAEKVGGLPAMQQVMDDIVNVYGQDSSALIAKAGIKRDYEIIADIPDKSSRDQMIKNTLAFSNVENAKQGLQQRGVSNSDIEKLRTDLMKSDYVKSLSLTAGNRGFERANAAVDQMVFEYASRINANGDKSESKKNLESIFTRSFKTINYPGATFSYPSNIKDSHLIDNFADNMTSVDQDYVKLLNVYVDPMSESAERKNAYIRETGTWINNGDNSGISLWTKGAGGQLERVTKDAAGKESVSLTWDQVKAFKSMNRGEGWQLKLENIRREQRNIWKNTRSEF